MQVTFVVTVSGLILTTVNGGVITITGKLTGTARVANGLANS